MEYQNLIKKYDNIVIICSGDYRDDLINYFSSLNVLKNIIYKTEVEVVKDLIGSYDKLARIKLAHEKSISSELAEIKLKNSLLVSETFPNDSSKINELQEIKKDYSKYLKKNTLINNLYKNKPILIINSNSTSDEFELALNILKELTSSIEYIYTNEDLNKKLDVFEFTNYKEEILFLLNKVARLVETGVDPNKIKVHLPSEYESYALELFGLANIKLNISKSRTLSDYEITKDIIKLLQDNLDEKLDVAFTKILGNYVNSNNPILVKIINIFNSYLKYDYTLKDIYDDLIYTLNNTKNKYEYSGGIKVINIQNALIAEDDYVFLVGLNQDIFPKSFKDEEYLLDFERVELGLMTSATKNKIVTDKIIQILKSTNIFYLSYSNILPDGSVPISSIISKISVEAKVEIKKQHNELLVSYSKKIDEIALGKHLDLFYKYDVTSVDLYTLYNMYPNNSYKEYDNSFSKVSNELLNKYLKDGITLSYTAIDKYNKCGFLFYIENVLKISRVSNEESLFIGNLIHHLLYCVLQEEEVSNLKEFLKNKVDEYVQIEAIALSVKDEFFINKYIDTLIYLLDFIQKHQESSEFNIFGLEKEFSIVLDLDHPVTLKGKIDKILTLDINQTKYAIVVDYKTGSTDFDLNRVAHGLNMQIMFYFYFLNNYSLDTYEFAGGYLQGVMPSNTFGFLENKTYIDQLNDHFKLEGYSNSSKDILRRIDKDIEVESKFVKGIKFKSDGEFYSYSLNRVIDTERFKKLLKLTEDNIYSTSKKIMNGEFDINPKLIAKSFDSCQYCNYRDLCFRSNSNYKELKDYKEFEFLEDSDDSN